MQNKTMFQQRFELWIIVLWEVRKDESQMFISEAYTLKKQQP